MQRAFLKLINVLLILVLVQSCANKKKMIYFQGDKAIKNDAVNNYNLVYKIDDLLNIMVVAKDAEAVKPFNLNTFGGSYTSEKNSNNEMNAGLKGYFIDANGEIDFPVLGKLKLAGLNRLQAQELIKKKLDDYVKEPSVHIELLNFKITILGDVSRPGLYSFKDERVTLTEAMGIAGDLNITALRKNILVIRDDNGVKTEGRIDLTTKDIFSSPYYFLKQNDLIYVEQNRAKKSVASLNTTAITLILTFTTFGITFLNLFLR